MASLKSVEAYRVAQDFRCIWLLNAKDFLLSVVMMEPEWNSRPDLNVYMIGVF